jgi:hypothetical protein
MMQSWITSLGCTKGTFLPSLLLRLQQPSLFKLPLHRLFNDGIMI